MIDWMVDPFLDYAFMKRALVACLVLCMGGVPVGLFMTHRRLSLTGDALSHAILPGVALAFAGFGLSVVAMALGGLVVGILVAMLAVALNRFTQLKEDTSLVLVYLMSLAAGVSVLSVHGSSLDLLHLLFGNILAIDDAALFLAAGVSIFSLFMMAIFGRGLVIASFDPVFAEVEGRGLQISGALFFVLLVINLIAAFLAMGTLMALGLLILPAIIARFWVQTIDQMILVGWVVSAIGIMTGLLTSFYIQIPAGPAVVLALGSMGLVSACLGQYGSVYTYFRRG